VHFEAGKVYLPQQTEARCTKFFHKGNLIALRGNLLPEHR
jgi:K+-sensing histidine kinase KdpD